MPFSTMSAVPVVSAAGDLIINLSSFLPHLITILIAFAIFGAIFIFRRKIVSIFQTFMKQICRKIPHADAIIDNFTHPLYVLVAVLSAYLGLRIILSGLFPNSQWALSLAAFLVTAMKAFIIIMVTWGLLRGSEPIVEVIRGANAPIDQTIVAFLSNIVKVVLVVLAAVMVMDAFNYDITGMITGLGLTGLTVALAAQDTASNFFGGIVIIADKPFSVGDWIQTSTIEGIVEDISLRSTYIRTFKDAVIIVPNSSMASGEIINWSKMNKRKVEMTLGFTYQTSQEKLDAVVNGIRKLLSEDEMVTDPIIVNFTTFNSSSLDVSVNYFVSTIDAIQYMNIKERINFSIMKLCEEIGAEFAYPTQTLFIEENDLEPAKNK